ncbi:MAG TPA: STAS domain-containing protein [Candidatus Acidoferrales bacterium]|nr:STAS domain-containing protein [Candidatus Acidoferrales bacterium]
MDATPSPPESELTLDIETTMEQIVVRCSGRITSTSVELLLNTVRPLILQTRRIALDLAQIRHLDSSGLGTVVQLWSAAKQAGTELSVVNLNERVQNILNIANLSSLFRHS